MKLLNHLRKTEDAIAGAMGGLVALLVAIIIGVLVFYKINGSFGNPGIPSGGFASWAVVNSTASTSFGLMPIVAIVVVAGLILSVVSGFGRGNSGGL